MGRKPSGPWYRTSHRAWYAKIGGRQVRLDTDLERARVRFAELTGPAQAVTVARLVDLYLADCAGRVKPATLELYRRRLGWFADVAGSLPASDVRPYHVTALMTADSRRSIIASTSAFSFSVTRTWICNGFRRTGALRRAIVTPPIARPPEITRFFLAATPVHVKRCATLNAYSALSKLVTH